jgi:serine protease Do
MKNKKKYYQLTILFSILFSLFLASCAFTLKNITTETTNFEVEKDKDSLNKALGFQNTLHHIANSVAPAVVNIRTSQKKSEQDMQGNMQDPFEFFRKFFGDRGFGGGEVPRAPENNQVLGSGFIISKDGYIITNAHVVNNAEDIQVQTSNQENFKGKLIGLDTKADIALIKITPSKKHNLAVAPLGNSDEINAGDFAIAIGNPFGLNGTITFGIISAKGRNNYIEENAPYKNYIQTDVPVNPGNSGGPLLNIKGQVIGVNSAIYSTSGGSIGISFAVPINIAKNVINQLVTTGHVTRGAIGIIIQPLPKDIAKYNHIPENKGLLVNDVTKGGPADKAGVKPGDIIIKLNGKNIVDNGDFVAQISSLSPKAKVTLGVIRDGKPLSLVATLIDQQSNKDLGSANNSHSQNSTPSQGTLKWQNMVLMDVAEAKNQGYRVNPSINGVIVVEINPQSKAASNGVRPGCIVTAINHHPIRSIGDIKKLLKEKQFLVQFRTANNAMNLFVILP